MLTTKTADATEISSPIEEAKASAVEAGLRYVRDDQPGFTRRRAGKGFVYLDEQRARISNDDVVERIRKLAIPPAWADVWICRFVNGHLQATGRDARTRKQYRYHAKWNESRNETKFSKLAVFGACLPKIREVVDRDLRLSGLPRDKVLAAVVRTMELTHIRVGNDIYAEENDSYGLTTIRNEHARVSGSKVKFKFKGKSGVLHDVEFKDPRLSRIIEACQDLPGEELFAYEDEDGVAHDVGSGDVNEYLRAITGENITAKDFRTWAGTVHALSLLGTSGPCVETTKKAWKSREVECFKSTAERLRNTVAVCRKYYVHPGVFEADRDGLLHKLFKKHGRRRKEGVLSPCESAVLELLEEIK